MIKHREYPDRETWLKERRLSLGASEIGIVCGQSNFKSVTELWEEKTGKKLPLNISNNEIVEYGTEAEKYLRELFALKHRVDYKVNYHPYRVYYNTDNPFLTCTLDGEITRIIDGAKGVYECKTVLINNKTQLDEWKGKIPNGYFCQTLQQLYCTGFEFVILNAELRFPDNTAEIREYIIERSVSEKDIEWIVKKGVQFWHYVQANKRPNVSLTL